MAFGAMLGSMFGKLGGAGGIGKMLGGLGQGGLKSAWQGAGGMGGLLGMGGQKMFQGGGSNMLSQLFGGAEEFGGIGGEQSPDEAMVGAQPEQTLQLEGGQTPLNPILPGGQYGQMGGQMGQMGGQFGYNAPQAGMKGLQNMGGLLGDYMNRGGQFRGGY